MFCGGIVGLELVGMPRKCVSSMEVALLMTCNLMNGCGVFHASCRLGRAQVLICLALRT